MDYLKYIDSLQIINPALYETGIIHSIVGPNTSYDLGDFFYKLFTLALFFEIHKNMFPYFNKMLVLTKKLQESQLIPYKIKFQSVDLKSLVL